MRMKASVPCSRGGCNTINWSYGTPAGEATARASSAVTPALESRKSTTTISLPMPFILANAWLASALMEFFPTVPVLYGERRRIGQCGESVSGPLLEAEGYYVSAMGRKQSQRVRRTAYSPAWTGTRKLG